MRHLFMFMPHFQRHNVNGPKHTNVRGLKIKHCVCFAYRRSIREELFIVIVSWQFSGLFRGILAEEGGKFEAFR